MEKKGTFASPAMARASRVLPVPGGPMSSTPLGMRPPSFWNFWGSRRNSMISCSSSLASSTPATSLKVTFFCWRGEELRLRLAEGQGLVPAALHLPHEEDPEADEEQEGRPGDEHVRPGRGLVALDVDLDLLGQQGVDVLLVAGGRGGLEGVADAVDRAVALALDLGAGDGHLGDLALLDLFHEGAEGERGFLLLDVGEMPGQEDDHQQRHPQHDRLERSVHFAALPGFRPMSTLSPFTSRGRS